MDITDAFGSVRHEKLRDILKKNISEGNVFAYCHLFPCKIKINLGSLPSAVDAIQWSVLYFYSELLKTALP